MSKTIEEFKKILSEYKEGCITDKHKFAMLLNILIAETLLDIREILRDIRTQLNEERNDRETA